MIEFLQNIEFWHWWMAATLLLILEIFAPGVVFVWIGISAALIGALLFAMPDMPWELQFSIWGIFAVLSAVIGRNYIHKNPIKTDQPALNQRGEQYVGRVFTLGNPIHNGVGTIKVDDSTWKIEAEEDFKKGTKIKVIGLDGVVLKVEKS